MAVVGTTTSWATVVVTIAGDVVEVTCVVGTAVVVGTVVAGTVVVGGSVVVGTVVGGNVVVVGGVVVVVDSHCGTSAPTSQPHD
jgi:hypothetical protein